ncbi:hypothetical protein [Streptomyces sp. NPDC020951]|uniref:hypothetical protein n=1 Tax=Streptomyces sp. NPDC020951 TaxID=3365104 RepID=UPI0037AE6074
MIHDQAVGREAVIDQVAPILDLLQFALDDAGQAGEIGSREEGQVQLDAALLK